MEQTKEDLIEKCSEYLKKNVAIDYCNFVSYNRMGY